MSRVFRCFTEKKPGFDVEAQGVLEQVRSFLGLANVENVRIFNRYDVEGVSDYVYQRARGTVFSEPQVDNCFDEQMPELSGKHWVLAVESLPGQYDQRADSCAQCIQILTCLERPNVNAAKIYVFFGNLSDEDKNKLENYLINPVESRQASMEKPETLSREHPAPEPVPIIDGFISFDRAKLAEMLDSYGLAMDIDDLAFMQSYFKNEEKRDPTVTELRLVDTYWSDHCRHTTFSTRLEDIKIEDDDIAEAYETYINARREVYGDKESERPKTLMDMATLATKVLRGRGLLKNIDISEEINACSIHVDANVNGKSEDWLLMFKNETHNHPTEIEPFGGAATCIGGAIRDPLSGRAFVYQAMRVTGAGDPRVPIEDTIPGKLPQRKLTVTAAQGYSSYGNQIGLSTGLVHEVYHPGYVAKRMEIGAVVGAVRAENVVRERPQPGDVVILLGGRTGRDGIGGATGSSKTHNTASLVTMASEVQKGNAPEERKIQRLFLNPTATKMIKRCNDFGAGGVSVAIGELADGLDIDLSLVRKKYEGLNGTEIAISESQERMAVVVAKENAEKFIALASSENLEAYVVAQVTEQPRMVMRLDGKITANLSREFLSSNGAEKHAKVKVPDMTGDEIENLRPMFCGTPGNKLRQLAGDLRFCSQRGLGERFDGSIGAGSILMPYGGKTRLGPVQSMAALLPVQDGETDTCSVMSFGFNPELSARNPYEGAKIAVITSIAKIVASGCNAGDCYLTFQEYFEKLRDEPERWGKPFSALLGALEAQLELGIAAIGGKDSMSGSFMDMDVPPTLVSFAIAPCKAQNVVTPEFKAPEHNVVLFPAGQDYQGIKNVWTAFHSAVSEGKILSAWAVTDGGVAEAVLKMSLGNYVGFATAEGVDAYPFFDAMPGAIVAEVTEAIPGTILLGRTVSEAEINLSGETVPLSQLQAIWESGLENVFPTKAGDKDEVPQISFARPSILVAKKGFAKPRAVITSFPGTNSELDTAKAVIRAGGQADIVVVKNLTPQLLEESVLQMERAIRESQMVIIPGGFSSGDEPDGSAKFITAFFKNPRITEAVHELLHVRDGLMLGICNGFQALVKLGLVPFGEIMDVDNGCPTLTYNLIGRHQSRYVYTRVSSVSSPWLSMCKVGDIHAVPISHGEGRFVANERMLESLKRYGQIATQYCDINGVPSMDIDVNPNGSVMAIEGIYSADGRVFGKMGHTERRGEFVAKNIYGNKHQPVFEGGVNYFI